MPSPAKSRQRVRAVSTGKDSELIEKLPITARRGTKSLVAMRLGPDGKGAFARIPDLAPGDRLEVSCEVEVTTDSSVGQEVGTPYRFDPLVEAQLFLTAGPDEIKRSARKAIPLSKRKRNRISHAQHHGLLVFGDGGLRIPSNGLAWDGPSYINLVLGASDPGAKRGNVLIVGENEPDGTINGSKGRINAVRFRPSSLDRPKAIRTQKLLVTALAPDNSKHVLFSLPLDGLRQGEQLVARAQLLTGAAHLPRPIRISTRLVLVDSPSQSDTGGRAKTIAACGGELGDHNGFNCTPAKSPCATDRVGVMLVEEDAGKKLYLNLVADSGDPTKSLPPGSKLKAQGGFLEVVRYAPDVKG
jgi:hypothetical protein